MHLLDLPEDALLQIIQRLRLVDVPTLVQTCKAFASLRETHLKHAFDLLRLVHKYALGSETLDIPPIGAEVRRKLALPQKFEEAMISGSLSENSFQRYETTVTNEDVYNTSLFPGGRWLVTVSGNRQPDAIESSLPSHIPAMKYRIWDPQKSRTDLLMSPVACVTMPPDESEISGEIWLRDDEDGEGYQIWAYSDHKLRELVFDPRDCCLYERRSINVLGLDTSYDIGLHGDYVFNYEDEFHILDRNNGVRASFQLSPEPMDGFLQLYRFLTIVDDGLVLLDSDKQNLLYYRPNIRQWGLRGMLGDDQFKSPRLELLRAIPIRGIESRIKDDFSYNPVVNRPFSPGKSSTALARFAGTFVHFEIPDDPALEVLERSFRIFPFRSWPETTPRVHAKTISGHVVAIAKPFDVHLLRTGEEVITHRVDYDLENADSNNAFVCPIGGILGATHRMEEMWLWKAGDHE